MGEPGEPLAGGPAGDDRATSSGDTRPPAAPATDAPVIAAPVIAAPVQAAVGGGAFAVGWLISGAGPATPLEAWIASAGIVGAVGMAGAFMLGAAAGERAAAVRTGGRRTVAELRRLPRSVASLAGAAVVLAVSGIAGIGAVGCFGALAAGTTVLVLDPVTRVVACSDRARAAATGATAAALVAVFVASRPLRLLAVAAVVAWVVVSRPRGGPTSGTTTPTSGTTSAVLVVAFAAAAATALAIALATGIAHPPAAVAAKDSVKVNAAQTAFEPAGIDVPAGKEVAITVKGEVRFIEGDDEARSTGDGSPAYYTGCDPVAFCGQLLVRVGDQGGGSAVGPDHRFVVQQPGPLQFAINDFDGTDNEGELTVTVDVHDAPTTTLQTFGGPTLDPGLAVGDVAGGGGGDAGGADPQPGPRTHAVSGLLAAAAAIGGVRIGRRAKAAVA